MGIDTLTMDKFMSEVDRVQNDLIDTGEARVSLEEIGDRKASKKVIEIALEGMIVKGDNLSFDGDTNEFVVSVDAAAPAADSADDDTEATDDEDDFVVDADADEEVPF